MEQTKAEPDDAEAEDDTPDVEHTKAEPDDAEAVGTRGDEMRDESPKPVPKKKAMKKLAKKPAGKKTKKKGKSANRGSKDTKPKRKAGGKGKRKAKKAKRGGATWYGETGYIKEDEELGEPDEGPDDEVLAWEEEAEMGEAEAEVGVRDQKSRGRFPIIRQLSNKSTISPSLTKALPTIRINDCPRLGQDGLGIVRSFRRNNVVPF